MKRFIICVFAFVSVCAMGLLTAMAGGVHWGTPEALTTTALTFTVASFLTIAIATFPGKI